MSERIYNGPYSLRMWLEGGNVGMEWHCPPGGCLEYRDRVSQCPYTEDGDRCNDTERQRAALEDWAITEFIGFVQLYRERA